MRERTGAAMAFIAHRIQRSNKILCFSKVCWFISCHIFFQGMVAEIFAICHEFFFFKYRAIYMHCYIIALCASSLQVIIVKSVYRILLIKVKPQIIYINHFNLNDAERSMKATVFLGVCPTILKELSQKCCTIETPTPVAGPRCSATVS